MSKFEKFLVWLGLIYNAVYFPVFVFLSEGHIRMFIPFLVLAMALILMVVILAFKDLYQRQFPSREMKLGWLAVMLLFGPSILIYLFRHAFKPRSREE